MDHLDVIETCEDWLGRRAACHLQPRDVHDIKRD